MHAHTHPTVRLSQGVLLHGAHGRPGGYLGALFAEALPCPAPQQASRPPESSTGWGLFIPPQPAGHPPCPHVQSSEGLRRYLFLPWGPLFQAVLVLLCLPSLRHPLRKKSHHLGLTLMQCDVWEDGKEKASSVSVPSAPSRGVLAAPPPPRAFHAFLSGLFTSLPCCPLECICSSLHVSLWQAQPVPRHTMFPETPSHCSAAPQCPNVHTEREVSRGQAPPGLSLPRPPNTLGKN